VHQEHGAGQDRHLQRGSQARGEADAEHHAATQMRHRHEMNERVGQEPAVHVLQVAEHQLRLGHEQNTPHEQTDAQIGAHQVITQRRSRTDHARHLLDETSALRLGCCGILD
jgi:hypothetical protein